MLCGQVERCPDFGKFLDKSSSERGILASRLRRFGDLRNEEPDNECANQRGRDGTAH